MAGPSVSYDSTQYEQLIGQVQTMVSDLDSSLKPGRDVAPGADLELQPEPQRWNVSADMVAAGRSFFGSVDAQAQQLVGRLEQLRDDLVAARSVFERTDDLATASARSWATDHPGLAPAPTGRS